MTHSKIKLEHVVGCPICDYNDSETIIHSGKDLLNNLPGEFNIKKCKKCSHHFTSPRPVREAIGYYYSTEYYTHHTEVNSIKIAIKKVLKSLKSSKNLTYQPYGAKKALEIGCGNGELLKKLDSLGWECTGTEIDKKNIQITKTKLPHIKIINGDINETEQLNNENFDLIVMSHVLEHMYDINRILIRLNELLSDNGKLIIQVPNFECWEARCFGRYWRGLELPRHLHHFTKDTLEQILRKNHFSAEKITYQYLPMSFSQSIIFYLNHFIYIKIPNSGALVKTIYHLVYIPLKLSIFFTSGNALEVIVKKDKINHE